MARRFTRAGSEFITAGAGSLGSAPVGAFSFAFVMRHAGPSGSAAQQIFRAATAGGSGVLSATLVPNTFELTVFCGSVEWVQSNAPVPANTWVLVTGSKLATVQPVNLGIYRFDTDTWIRETREAEADPNAVVSTVNLGRHHATLEQALDGDMALGALWARALGVSEFDRLPTGLAAWSSLAPTAAWLLDQQSIGQAVMDWTGGGANQTAIAGTSVSPESAPLSYGHPVLLARQDPAAAPAQHAAGGVLSAATQLIPSSLSTREAAAGLTAATSLQSSAVATTAAAAALTAAAQLAGAGQRATLSTAQLLAASELVAGAASASSAASPLSAESGLLALPAAAAGSAATLVAEATLAADAASAPTGFSTMSAAGLLAALAGHRSAATASMRSQTTLLGASGRVAAGAAALGAAGVLETFTTQARAAASALTAGSGLTAASTAAALPAKAAAHAITARRPGSLITRTQPASIVRRSV
jgi:hypothetical protein